MAEDPQALRRDIEETRRQLTGDVDALADKVSPRQIVHRRTDAARNRLSMMRHRVMGTSDHAKHAAESSAHEAVSSVQEVGSRIGDAVGSAPAEAKERTRGAPLAAGMVAFAAGWVIAAALPPTVKERELAARAKETAAEPLKDRAGEVAQDLKENLREPAQKAVDHVRQSATEATEQVKDETRSATADVKDQTQHSADSVRQQT
ncbi:DUF3618 domain-containing protein [Kribbella pittospori]|uniref:DUF3618 domain-containing protein n=1 Tax=Kribbella pittospori TaxID=722689 RepID=A0A4R0KPD2_9ACTN|nr:DUF3618 domain-containing protein [Kribbella pittospori]TCC57755.1 DUF3618 domain-containing protein [Kribbella pittospori]